MRVVVFGGTGMVGQGVLREALAAPDVTDVLTVGRRPTAPDPRAGARPAAPSARPAAPSAQPAPTGAQPAPTGAQPAPRGATLREVTPADLFDFASYVDEMRGYDACFFCLGVSSAGMSETAYRRITYDLTVAVATALADVNPGMVFVYVSGAGTRTDGRMMWARVKGATEDAVLALPLRGYAMRPGLIQPGPGITSRTGWYRVLYAVMRPLTPLIRRVFPGSTTTTEAVGQAMLRLGRGGVPGRIIEGVDINALAA